MDDSPTALTDPADPAPDRDPATEVADSAGGPDATPRDRPLPEDDVDPAAVPDDPGAPGADTGEPLPGTGVSTGAGEPSD